MAIFDKETLKHQTEMIDGTPSEVFELKLLLVMDSKDTRETALLQMHNKLDELMGGLFQAECERLDGLLAEREHWTQNQMFPGMLT